MSTPIEWTAAEREAVTDICTHEGLGKACDRCWDTISDALIALAPFVAERERQAAARALYRTVGAVNPYYADDQATLYGGDALAVLRELPAASVDAILTDPPYKLSQEYGATTDPDNLLAVSSLWPVAQEMYRLAKPGAVCAMFYDTRILPLALETMRDAGWKYLRALTLYRRWGQASLMYGWMSTSDFVLVFVKPGEKHKWHGKPAHDVYVRDKAEPVAFGHPAQKPLTHCRHIASNICPEGGVILDPYMGTGTSGVAAMLERRKFIGVEMVEHYQQVAERRIREAQGQAVQRGDQGALEFADTLTADRAASARVPFEIDEVGS